MSLRRRPSEPPTEVNLGAVITPMLDTCFQLLFFFIIMYRPHVLEGQMIMSLPDKSELQGPEAVVSNPAADIEPKMEAELTVVVKTQHDGINDGVISQIAILERGLETQIPHTRTGEPDLKALYHHLKKTREGLSNQDDIKVQGDGRLKWEGMMRVVDICLQAGFKNPGFQAPPDAAPANP
ncbi:MAG TPA: biopolymer transporter ExbD [Gemmataceae bacterium]|nr:biopolymer transporter ExbD [Gemmataceae bacterium]